MVTKWGLSRDLGPMKYGDEADEPFLGRSVGSSKQGISDETAHRIDSEIKNIIEECYSKASEILEKNLEKLHVMAKALMEYETLDESQINDVMAGAEPRASYSENEKEDSSDDKDQDPSVGDTAEQS